MSAKAAVHRISKIFSKMAASPCTSVGSDGTILHANKAELELLGYPAEEYVGRPLADFYADQHVIDDILARLTGGENIDKYPARLRAKDGSIKHVEITSSAQFRDGEFVQHSLFHR